MHQVRFNYLSYNDCVVKKLRALTDMLLSRDRSFVASNFAADNACSASIDVGSMVNNALNNCSNLLGIFVVASSSLISCLITV